MAAPKVFISYSHDDEAHKERVLWLSDSLRRDGIESEIDLYELAPPKGWTAWMWEKIDWADFVLMVCTETYRRRARRQEKPGKGLGVLFETSLLVQELQDAGMTNNRFIPILFDGATREDIPKPVRGYTFYRIVEDEGGYEDLLRHLLGRPLHTRPPVGKPPELPSVVSPSATKPAFYNIPLGTEFFTGREGHLEELERRLQSEHSVAITQAIVGLGGIGKTQVAIEYCQRHREKYPDGVFWVDASSAATLKATYAECAKELRLVNADAKEEEGVAALMVYLRQRPGWLVVMDNADAPDEVRDLRPRFLHGHVLVTTRDQAPDMGTGIPISIDRLPLKEATDLLLNRSRRGPEHRAGAGEVAKALGRLPLALEQAGSYLARMPLSFESYLEKFRKVPLRYLEKKSRDSEKTVAATWEINFEDLQKSFPAAAEVLSACGFLDPESIPARILREGAEHLGSQLEALAAEIREDEEVLLEQVVRPLTRYSLAKWDSESESLSVHRLVQMVSRWRLGEEASVVLDGVYAALGSIFPEGYENPSTWAEGAVLLPHVSRSAEFWEEGNGVEVAKGLWFDAGSLAWTSGRNMVALAIHEKALEACREVLGEEDASTLTATNQLALTLSALGDPTGAKELEEQALEASRRILGPEHPNTLTSMGNLASYLRDLGDLTGAKELLEQALEARRRIQGPEHPDTLMSMNNFASTLSDLGDFTGAKELHEQALEAQRRILGSEHPNTLTSMGNLASSLSALGDPTGAKELEEQALEARRRIQGPEHPDTLMSMNHLASSLRALGDPTGAKELLEQALEALRRILGPEHPSTLKSMGNLAWTLRALGDPTGAKELEEQALEAQRRILGSEHPNTLTSMGNLASSLRDLGDPTGAKELNEQALEALRRIQGHEHPDTLTSMNNLASTLSDLGDPTGAKELNEQALEARRRILGPEHPDTLNSMNNLAYTLSDLGDPTGAKELEDQVLEARRRIQGPEHPDTLISMNNLAWTLKDLGDLTKAKALFAEALEGRIKILGEEHPDTKSTAQALRSLEEPPPRGGPRDDPP